MNTSAAGTILIIGYLSGLIPVSGKAATPQTIYLKCYVDQAWREATCRQIELPVPCPSPTPTPVPTPTPTPTPTPPPPGACPWPSGESLAWVGIRLLSVVPVKTQGGVYLGKRYNYDATPHSRGEHCQIHRPGQQQCDQLLACQDPEGPDFYMSGERFKNERCDKNSANPWQCHDKPKANETGFRRVCAVPRGDPPDSPRGRCVTVNVQP